MVHKPKHRVHSFRGLLGDGGQDEISLERQNVNLAYRVVKFQAIDKEPGTNSLECVLKIYREEQSTIDAVVNFEDVDILGVVYFTNNTSTNYATGTDIIFDNVLFSRNIYVTSKDATGNANSTNYYLEIEEVPVGAATLMQLKLGVARKLNLQQD